MTKNIEFDFIKLIHDSGGRANRAVIIGFRKLLLQALQQQREEMKKIVKKSKPVFFIGKGMTDEIDRAVSNAIHEVKAQIYEDLFTRKEKTK